MQKKAFKKIQHSFVIKTFTKMGIEETYFNITKAIYNKSTTKIILNNEMLKTFPLKSGIVIRMRTLITSLQNSIGCFSHSNQTRKRNKNWKGRGKIVTICR